MTITPVFARQQKNSHLDWKNCVPVEYWNDSYQKYNYEWYYGLGLTLTGYVLTAPFGVPMSLKAEKIKKKNCRAKIRENFEAELFHCSIQEDEYKNTCYSRLKCPDIPDECQDVEPVKIKRKHFWE